MKNFDTSLYFITDSTGFTEEDFLRRVEGALRGGVTFLQIREKDLDENSFEAEAAKLKELCAKHKVPYVVNDSVEIALAIDADGVHVGQSDIKGRDIRSLIGPDKILGISAGTIEEAVAAEQAGADYIGVGAVFGTSTKKNARNLTVEKLREISSAVSIPVVAIGGINANNIADVIKSGIRNFAIVRAVCAADNPHEAIISLNEIAAKAREES